MTDEKQKRINRFDGIMVSAAPFRGEALWSHTTMDLLAVPNHPRLMEAIGRLVIAHTHLEQVLRYTVKTLSGWSIEDTMQATNRKRVSALREFIRQLFKEKNPPAPKLDELNELLKDAQALSERRNAIMHSVWSETEAGQTVWKKEDYQWSPAPSKADVDILTDKILELAAKINNERLKGFIWEATK